MSASDIDTLLNLWGASTATQGGAPPFQTTETCMILLTQLHLVTPHGRVSPFVLMGINLKAKFLHGWILTMISGFIIHANLFITSSQTQISRMGLTMHLIKSTISMEVITIIILCLELGLGHK